MHYSLSKSIKHRGEGIEAASPALARALVVDDEAFMLDVVGGMLGHLGYQVDSARGSREAIRRLNRWDYDLVITDLQMPEMNGHALAEWIKNRFSETVVIIMTGNSAESVIDYRHTGIADNWIFKPFNLSELEKTLHAHVKCPPNESLTIIP